MNQTKVLKYHGCGYKQNSNQVLAIRSQETVISDVHSAEKFSPQQPYWKAAKTAGTMKIPFEQMEFKMISFDM